MRKDQEAMTSAEAVQHIQALQRLQQKNASGGSIEAQEYDGRFKIRLRLPCRNRSATRIDDSAHAESHAWPITNRFDTPLKPTANP